MTRRVMKYNPAFLSHEELLEQFVVRQDDLQAVLQTVRENTASSNQHVLVIGPRGSGKTMLVRRVAAAIAEDPSLCERWLPIIFAEESYQVTSPGELWLEAIFHLGQQTKDDRWLAKYNEYGAQWRDEDTMRERALGQLLAFADEQGKRLLLIVENLGSLLGDQISDDDAWKLRHTLQNEPRIMLLATATSRFEEIDNAGKAMYELFRVHHLHPLNQDATRTLWHVLTGQTLEGDRVRPMQILTGGNLRLLVILSAFGARQSLRELMNDLVALVDEHTEYFKSHLDALAPVERKVYLGLAELWDPATARDVAVVARLDVNRTSALLRRLVERGAVVTLEESGRTNWYQVAERLYNAYYLLRRRGAQAHRVRALVRFMISFYQPQTSVVAAHQISDEAPRLTPTRRQDRGLGRSDTRQAAIGPSPEGPQLLLSLAFAQCAQGRLQDSLSTAEKWLKNGEIVARAIDRAIEILVELAARGEGSTVLEILSESPSQQYLEPLVAGIRVFLGEKVRVAVEIQETGFDVARRIAQRRDELRIDHAIPERTPIEATGEPGTPPGQ